MKEMLLALWRYRNFILSSINNELRLRFVRSKLGGAWMILHPLAQVLIFTIILSEVLSAKLPGIDNKHAYALYLMAGTLGWTLFADTIGKCVNLFIENGNLMKKMAFPRICLPFIAGGATLVTNLLLLLAIMVVFAFMGHFPDRHIVWLPVLIGITLLLSIGVGLILGVLNVFMRDIGQVVPVLLQALFWLTPIVYVITILPEGTQHWFRKNPLFPLISSYQNVLVYGQPPMLDELAKLTLVSVVLLVVALVMFRRASPEMVDAL